MLRAEKTSAGPVGLGARFRAWTKSAGRAVPMDLEITEYDRPRRLASHATLSGMDIDGTVRFEPVADGPRMTWSGDLEPRGLSKLLGPLIGWMGDRNERAIWTSLKHHLEAARPA